MELTEQRPHEKSTCKHCGGVIWRITDEFGRGWTHWDQWPGNPCMNPPRTYAEPIPIPAPAREPDGDVASEMRLAYAEAVHDCPERDGWRAAAQVLQAKHDAELQSLREQHQKDMEMALADPSHGEVNIFDLAASPAEHIPVTVIRRGLLAFLASRRALIAKDAPKEIEVPEGMLKAATEACAHHEGKTILCTQAALLAVLRWQRDNQGEMK